jgi:Nif-specific regulatory protein
MAKKNVMSETEVRKLSILIEINQVVSRTFELAEALQATLRVLQKSYNIKSGAVFLVNEKKNGLIMSASIGYNQELAKIDFKLGEGLTGRIAETGKPIIASQVSKEPLFLNRMSSWDPERDREQSFIGVPILLDYKTLGVLAVTLAYNKTRDFDSSVKFLTLVSSALVQSIQLKQMIELERQKLLEENVHLKQQLQEEFRFHKIIGNSHEMLEVYEMVARSL